MFSKSTVAKSTDFVVDSLLKLLGWQYDVDVDGDKSCSFGHQVKALGVEIRLEEFASGRVLFANTEKRRADLLAMLDA